MKKTPLLLALLLGTSSLANAATFYTPVGISSSNSVAYFPLSRLIEGPGVGYTAAAPHDAPGAGHTWVTNAPGGFPSDYIAVAGAPKILIDLGKDSFLTEISTWGYTTSNANGIKTFDLRFATSAQGPAGLGLTIAGQNGFTAAFSDITRDSHPLIPVTARYVEFTGTSTYITNGGNGPPAGGDRAGLGEIAFAIPEPSGVILGSLGLLGLLRRRRA